VIQAQDMRLNSFISGYFDFEETLTEAVAGKVRS
jgi:hypothetical protein